ncbi:MAG TPA: hypothetical protein VGM90_07225 [Kofleriaceae bacterium]|jgi:hypothetical protein
MNRLYAFGVAVAPLIATLATVATLATTGQASADPARPSLLVKDLPGAAAAVPATTLAGSTIFVNRCVGGCTVKPGFDNAPLDTSLVPNSTSTLAEYTNFTGTEWADIVQCVKEIYSPYNVNVTDQRPSSGAYEQIMVGGSPQSLGLPAGVGGIGSMLPGCTANGTGMAFAFTSAIDIFAQEAGGSRVYGMCWIIAQETAHNFGLDHEYSYVDDDSSACNDPMTYRADCGGQKFFRNRNAHVGATALCGNGDPSNACRCGDEQNSHEKLLAVFGPGQSTVAAPTVNVTLPSNMGQLAAVVAAQAGSQRGVARVDWYFNGWKWGSSPGAMFGRTGQPAPSSYQLTVPTRLPNSDYDIVAKAYDDLGTETVSATISATKGAACTAASTCLAGQKCDAGKCFWEQPTGEVGDSCTYNEACKNNLCAGTDSTKICTQSCVQADPMSCPADLVCNANGNVCFLPDGGGGCCSASDHTPPWGAAVGSFLVVFLVLRRRSKQLSLTR